MGRFTYWRNGLKVVNAKTSTSIKSKLKSGYFDLSPFWNEAEREFQKFQSEIENWKIKNPNASKLAFDDWFIQRRSIYNKKIFKLKDAHQNYESKRLYELENLGVDLDCTTGELYEKLRNS